MIGLAPHGSSTARPSKIYPNRDFWFEKYAIWQPCPGAGWNEERTQDLLYANGFSIALTVVHLCNSPI
jgi:hypothetical protein